MSIDDVKPAVREVTPVAWPGTDKMVGLLHLNLAELQDAHADARRHCKRRDIPADVFSAEELEKEEMAQQCFRALVDPDARVADARLFESVDQLRQRMDAEERAWFCALHERLYGLKARGMLEAE